jgi:V8-like Glu-specific endopeptidase
VTGHYVSASGSSAAAARAAAAFWTRSRMLSARDADILTAKPGTIVNQATRTSKPTPAGRPAEVAGTAPTQALAGGIRTVPGGGRMTPMTGSAGSPWAGNFYLPPATTTGKVFFDTTAGGRTEYWVCSGSTVNSNGKDIVMTAGHCVYGSLGGQVPGEGWHANWVFVPDYDNGYAPYGMWTASQLWTLNNYISNGGSLADEGDDIGAVVMNTNSSGQHIVNVVGGQGIRWNYPDNQFVYDFGYPAESPFNGLVLDDCTGSQVDESSIEANNMGLSCNFTGGSSGGPWLSAFGGEFGYINGVNDWNAYALPGVMLSAYFGNNAGNLYNTVANL